MWVALTLINIEVKARLDEIKLSDIALNFQIKSIENQHMMKNIFKILTTLLFYFLLSKAQAQDAERSVRINIVPPSPNSAALAKYADFPANQYTGIPQISLPLGSIGNKKISVPISLTYHAGGMKVEETASWVGLGWSLSGGGVITRTVRGLPDEISDGIHLGFNHIKEHIYNFENETHGFDEAAFLSRVAEGFYDTEPDQYFFNFQNKTGSVIFDPQGNGTVIPFQKLKIIKSLNGFTITDETGTEYTFEELEQTENSDLCSTYPIGEFVSSWHLSLIKLPSGETAQFGYARGTTYQQVFPEETAYNLYSTYNDSGTNQNCPNLPSAGCVNTSKISTARLQSITIDKSQINFISTTQRTDLIAPSNDYRLDAIEFVYNNTPAKRINFEYNVFGCNKLRLDQIKQSDPLALSTPELLYKFEYYNPEGVPCTNSKAQDHWGFYNNSIMAASLVPPGIFVGLNGIVVPLEGTDRSPNFERTRTGILDKIIYPTGGYTQFEYELNNYGFIKDTKVQEWLEEPRLIGTYADYNNQYQEENFTINKKQPVFFEYKINVLNDDNGNENPSYYEYAAIIDNATNAYVKIISVGKGSLTLELLPGSYKLVTYSENPITYTSASLNYIAVLDLPVITKSTGGIRVAKITDRDGLGGNEDMVRTYKYTMSNEPGRSSGVIMGVPEYTYYYTTSNIDPQTGILIQ